MSCETETNEVVEIGDTVDEEREEEEWKTVRFELLRLLGLIV
ncbi:MAG: hypothetical protein QXS20_09110 [Candidatus Thorarchaeota archaeon]